MDQDQENLLGVLRGGLKGEGGGQRARQRQWGRGGAAMRHSAGGRSKKRFEGGEKIRVQSSTRGGRSFGCRKGALGENSVFFASQKISRKTGEGPFRKLLRREIRKEQKEGSRGKGRGTE